LLPTISNIETEGATQAVYCGRESGVSGVQYARRDYDHTVPSWEVGNVPTADAIR